MEWTRGSRSGDVKQFGGKAKAIELNAEAARLGQAYCSEELTKSDPYAVEARGVEDGGFFIEK